MAAINLLTREPVIPFIRKRKEEDIKEVTLSNAVVQMIVPAGAVAAVPLKNVRQATLVVAVDDDVETLLRLVLSFLENIGAHSLALQDGQLYIEFRKCLRDIVLECYDQIVDAIPVRNRANFEVLLTQLIAQFCKPTAYADQRRYMETYKKPFKLTVKQLANRLIVINKYTQYLPGSGNVTVYDPETIKPAFFNMMLAEWQMEFAKTP